MKGTFKIEIDNKLTEQKFVEHCLNMKYSGYDCNVVFFFYALGKRWKVEKLTYYLKLLEAKE